MLCHNYMFYCCSTVKYRHFFAQNGIFIQRCVIFFSIFCCFCKILCRSWRIFRRYDQSCTNQHNLTWCHDQWRFENMSHSDTDKYLYDHPIPAVYGPDGKFYITNHHHLVSALIQASMPGQLCRVLVTKLMFHRI